MFISMSPCYMHDDIVGAGKTRKEADQMLLDRYKRECVNLSPIQGMPDYSEWTVDDMEDYFGISRFERSAGQSIMPAYDTEPLSGEKCRDNRGQKETVA